MGEKAHGKPSDLAGSWAGSGTWITAGAVLGLLAVLAGARVEIPDGNGWASAVFYALGGMALALWIRSLLPLLRRAGEELEVEDITVDAPILGSVKLKLRSDQRKTAWTVFVELSSRITCWSLEQNGRKTGELGAALTSFHSVFQTVRAAQGERPPWQKSNDANEASLETLLSALLNRALRPLLSTWHPRLDAWKKGGEPEALWPLADHCRDDIERTRWVVLGITHELGRIAHVAHLEDILPPRNRGLESREPILELVAEPDPDEKARLGELDRRLGELAPTASGSREAMAWRVWVEVSTRLPEETLTADPPRLRQAITALQQALALARGAWIEAGPFPATQDGPRGPSLDQLLHDLIERDLRPVLQRWHVELQSIESMRDPDTHAKKRAQACRYALLATRDCLRERLNDIGHQIGAPTLDPPASTESP